MNNKDLYKCPYCGETDMCYGKQWSYGQIFKKNSMFVGRGSDVMHIICKNCGTIVRSYVKDVEKLK